MKGVIIHLCMDQTEKRKHELEAVMTERAIVNTHPLYFAPPPPITSTDQLNSGSISLIKVDNKQIGVTCFHVIDTYRQRLVAEKDLCVMLLNYKMDNFEERIISESQNYDLVTIDLDDISVAQIKDYEGEVPCEYMEIDDLEAISVQEGESILFGGWPGGRRIVNGGHNVDFGSFTSSKTIIDAVSEENIIVNINKAHTLFDKDGTGMGDAPGMSGGMAIKVNITDGGIITGFAPAGIIYAGGRMSFAPDILNLQMRPINLLQNDGKIRCHK